MEKKQLIMEKALELFAENGIESTSIQEITERCGISKGAFYLAFTSKNQLISGLIDYFLGEFVVDVDRLVMNEQQNDKLLFIFYQTIFQEFHNHCDFAKIFLKEPSASFNIELLERIKQYDVYLSRTLFSLVERQFPHVKGTMKIDLIYMIKGFIKHYAEPFFISKHSVDVDNLCYSLVEKTKIIADHATIPYLQAEMLSGVDMEQIVPTKEQLEQVLSEKMNETNDVILCESLELLKHDLTEGQLPYAVVLGLLKNLRENSHCKWTAYLYELYVHNR